jgi:hypothetical protein
MDFKNNQFQYVEFKDIESILSVILKELSLFELYKYGVVKRDKIKMRQ